MAKTNFTVAQIYFELIRNYKCRTIIIAGRPGRTGKTWLYNQLKQTNLFTSVIEVSNVLKSYYDEGNHLIECEECVVVVLNKPLAEYKELK